MPPRKSPASAVESEKRAPANGSGSTNGKNGSKKKTALVGGAPIDAAPVDSVSGDGASIQETVIITGGSGRFDRSAVERRAWEIWQNEGCPHGREVEHWLQAERELGLS